MTVPHIKVDNAHKCRRRTRRPTELTKTDAAQKGRRRIQTPTYIVHKDRFRAQGPTEVTKFNLALKGRRRIQADGGYKERRRTQRPREPVMVDTAHTGRRSSLGVMLADEPEHPLKLPPAMSAQRLPPEPGQVGGEKVGRGAPFELHEVKFGSGPGPLDVLGVHVRVVGVHEVLL